MKWRGCFLFFLLSFYFITAARGQLITFSVKNERLEKVFLLIEQQSDYHFIYTTEQVEKAKPVTLSVSNEQLSAVLNKCFAGQPLLYNINEKNITVKEKKIVAAERPLRGKVLNEKGEPAAGVTIQVKGTNKLTAADINGDFYLADISSDDILIISGVEIETLQISVSGRDFISVTAHLKISTLDETVVIGYGKTTKRISTGNISKISAEEIARQPVPNPLSALQGRAAGVFVTTQNGMPGGNITVQIRGKGSINAGTDPLYVVDGVPFISTPLNLSLNVLSTGIAGSTSPLNSINPSDIESIEILKDADATAIYGSRAANGVVLITTRKGKAGKSKFDINIYHGINRLSNLPEMLNPEQYLAIRREAFQNDGITPTEFNAPDLMVWDTAKSTDWVKYILGRTASVLNVQGGISGGNELTNFLITGNYRTESTILPGDQRYTRAGAHVMLQHRTADKKFSIELSSNYSSDNAKLLPSSVFGILNLPPNLPLYDSLGKYNWTGVEDVHPAAVLKQRSKSQTEYFLNNLVLRYEILPYLYVRTSLGYSKIQLDQVMTYPLISLNPNYGSLSYAYYGNNKHRSYIIEPQLDFSKKLNGSNIQMLVGGTWQNSIREGSLTTGSNYNNDELIEYASSAGTVSVTNIYTQYKYASLFGRFHYDYKEKYILNASIRRDGSSRFGPGNQIGIFGAVGMAWVFSREKFLNKSSFLSYGKIRGSYGITGNDQITDYQYLSTYRTGSVYQDITGLNPSRVANADFGWESNKKLEIGLETGFIKDRILLTISWYRNRSGNQLIDYPLPLISGPFGSYQANLPALVENKGWEFELNVAAIKKEKLQLNVFGNISIPKNKLLKYPGLESSSFANKYVIGEDLSIKKAFHLISINSQTGLPEYEDVNTDGVISAPADYTIVGTTAPLHFGGFGSNFHYGQFEASIFFQFSKQFAQGTSTIPGIMYNQFAHVADRWNKPGDISAIPKATTIPTSVYSKLASSDAAFYNAAYTRLKNVSLAYSLPLSVSRKLKLRSCRFYVEGQNLITWSKQANLYDPETGISGIAPLKSIVWGIHLTF